MDSSSKLPAITISIVSHNQSALINFLLIDLAKIQFQNFVVIITLNLPEDESVYQGHSFPIYIIRNFKPKGFGENHNAAFALSSSTWFVIANPDIRIHSLDFEILLSPFESKDVAAVAPIVLSGDGAVEDSARHFPSIHRLFRRVFLGDRSLDYEVGVHPYEVEWVGGMFIVFRSEAYLKIGGFDDQRFFMYLEDADICERFNKNGWKVVVNPYVNVIHRAQRSSRRKIKYMYWHIISAFRYLTGI